MYAGLIVQAAMLALAPGDTTDAPGREAANTGTAVPTINTVPEAGTYNPTGGVAPSLAALGPGVTNAINGGISLALAIAITWAVLRIFHASPAAALSLNPNQQNDGNKKLGDAVLALVLTVSILSIIRLVLSYLKFGYDPTANITPSLWFLAPVLQPLIAVVLSIIWALGLVYTIWRIIWAVPKLRVFATRGQPYMEHQANSDLLSGVFALVMVVFQGVLTTIVINYFSSL